LSFFVGYASDTICEKINISRRNRRIDRVIAVETWIVAAQFLYEIDSRLATTISDVLAWESAI
jgi:hypothetical protein